MKKREKQRALRVASEICNAGGAWMLVVTACQMTGAAQTGTVGGFAAGMLAALGCGLLSLLLWSYGLTFAEKAGLRRNGR